MSRTFAHGSLGAALVAGIFTAMAATGVVACSEGCRSNATTKPTAPPLPDPGPPTLRLYLISNMAGALEPCGCTKDQLGGLDHLAAFIAQERSRAPASALVSAGPVFFMDPVLKEDKAEQDRARAETIAKSLSHLGFAAFTPGINDWAAGEPALLGLAKTSQGALVLSNRTPPLPEPTKRWTVQTIGGINVGFIGLGTAAGLPPGAPPASSESATIANADAVVNEGLEALRKDGAHIFVLLSATGRGQAKRMADNHPELTAIVVGNAASTGEGNTTAPAAEQIGRTIIAESANHLQSVGILDLFVRNGSFAFADASGLELARKREELTRRIDDLRIKIANWETGKNVSSSDLAARKADLSKLEGERDRLDAQPPPAQGSFFRYSLKEVREKLGSEPSVTAEMLAYYKQVNERNRIAFADRRPRSHTGEQPTYIGINACSTCHPAAREVWDKTPHARAYETLSKQHKEFNLDCVSCHVTGYEQPGGSTVTFVERLKDVQCETCHGPGSKHALTADKSLITRTPQPTVCTGCHHPPHVEQFDPVAKMGDVLGPGHGRPRN